MNNANTLVSGRAYKYYVTAFNTLGGESDFSEALAVVPIQEPNALQAAPVLVERGQEFATLSWLPPDFDGGAVVERYVLFVMPEYETEYMQVYSGISLQFTVL